MFSDPRHISEHAKAVMIEQLVHCAVPEGISPKDFRDILSKASFAHVAEYWQTTLGDLLEEKGA